jgi:hypothetical protein
MLNPALGFYVQVQKVKLKQILQPESIPNYRICMNTMPHSAFIDRLHCYNKEVVSNGAHLNFY